MCMILLQNTLNVPLVDLFREKGITWRDGRQETLLLK